ncbi:unnamed protein product, partial [marine sediment metagenome]
QNQPTSTKLTPAYLTLKEARKLGNEFLAQFRNDNISIEGNVHVVVDSQLGIIAESPAENLCLVYSYLLRDFPGDYPPVIEQLINFRAYLFKHNKQYTKLRLLLTTANVGAHSFIQRLWEYESD